MTNVMHALIVSEEGVDAGAGVWRMGPEQWVTGLFDGVLECSCE